jgi:LysM repeat protein
MDSLKSAVRDGQRVRTDLRIELADRRKELADVHVARAQLQGMLRETERRLADARQIIELQREELEAARTDRVRIEESGRQLHGRLRRLERLLARAKRLRETGEVIPSGYAPRPSTELIQPLHVSPSDAPVVTQPVMTTDIEAPRSVVVHEGETLWRLARRHQVDLDALRQLNGLRDNRIATGWTLRLPASTHAAGMHASGSRRMVR